MLSRAQTFTVYEEDISDSRAQLAAVTVAAASLPQMSGFDEDHYETLATKTTQCAPRPPPLTPPTRARPPDTPRARPEHA